MLERDDYLDAAAAIGMPVRNIPSLTFGGDRTRIYVSGHSAGGHLTAMLALSAGSAMANEIKDVEIPDRMQSAIARQATSGSTAVGSNGSTRSTCRRTPRAGTTT